MSTTTIRLPEDLKERLSANAERAGKTTHSYIVDALAEKAEMDELRAEFWAEADAREKEMDATGEFISWEDMDRYLEGLIAGKSPAAPKVSKKRN